MDRTPLEWIDQGIDDVHDALLEIRSSDVPDATKVCLLKLGLAICAIGSSLQGHLDAQEGQASQSVPVK